jgi:hypothetical protein
LSYVLVAPIFDKNICKTEGWVIEEKQDGVEEFWPHSEIRGLCTVTTNAASTACGRLGNIHLMLPLPLPSLVGKATHGRVWSGALAALLHRAR